jgi:tRNA(Arg) A34 adenosine deaminase TadA
MMAMRFRPVTLRLPSWVEDMLPDPAQVYPTVESRMRLAIELARHNVRRKTGGPFGAGIFDLATHTLVAPGVNLVIAAGCSVAHAEIVAIAVAEQLVGSYDLGRDLPGHELVSSVAPCAMCLGAIPWSGVRRLVCGAREEDARRIGFDEGTKPPSWVAALEQRRVTVIQDVCREEAAAVLQEYAAAGGQIYNPGDCRGRTPGG